MIEEKESNSRREFIKKTVAGLTAITILPSNVISGMGHPSPGDKLNIAVVGVGGIGFQNLNNLKDENIVALCDVDWDYGQKAFRRWSSAARYKDYRVMLEKEKNIDAVLIASPDHTHACVALSAMQLQKHVYVQAPMAHSVFEVRRMVETARIFNLATQVGNQRASGDFTRDISEIIWSGAIGEVREVKAWTSQPKWKQGVFNLEKKMYAPSSLDWNLFLGPATEMPYHPKLTPYGWRTWWNFGNGALGSLGAHILEPAFRALKLKAPISVEASSTLFTLDTAPQSEQIIFSFGKRENLPNLAMPPLKLTWHDGGLLPELVEKDPSGFSVREMESGLIFRGSEGYIISDPMAEKFAVFIHGEEVTLQPEKVLHRIPNSSSGHEADWVRACKENHDNRLETSANFESQAVLTETLLVGSMAVRLQSLSKKLEWDSGQMGFSNINLYEEFEIKGESDYYVDNGMVKFSGSKKMYNAASFVNQSVRPIYRSGWQQL